MTASHHPNADVLTAYASGGLRTAFAAVVAAHLERCPACAEQVRTLEAVGGALIEDLPRADLADDALAKALTMVEGAPQFARSDRAPPTLLERIKLKPSRWLAPGMWMSRADRSQAGPDLLYVLRVSPGMAMPRHGHRGMEFTGVLKGAYVDDTGRYGPGDFQETSPEVEHKPVSGVEGDCICIVASEKPMRMMEPIARLMQPLFGV